MGVNRMRGHRHRYAICFARDVEEWVRVADWTPARGGV
jgi:hypothetical protein